MTLLDRATAILEGDQTRALAALRPLFMVIKLATRRETFDRIAAVVPEADQWSREAVQGDAGRTGELLGLITPDTLEPRIRDAGLSDDEINHVGRCVGQFLMDSIDRLVADEVAAKIPLVELPVGM